jgi:hypothetical protein
MSRQYVEANPDAKESPVQTFENYPPAQRSLLMKAIGAALVSTQDKADGDFERWMQKQNAESS